MAADDRSTPVRLDATVHGRVQGVGYRIFVGRTALARGIVGWVANEPGGSVRCVAEGPRATLEAFLAELAVGPPGADVERVVPTWGPALGGSAGFSIRSGWHGGD